MKKKFEIVLVDNYDATDNYTYEDYKEHCEANDVEPGEEDSTDYYDYVHSCVEQDFEILNEELDTYLETHTLVAYGSIGRWNGTHSGGYIVRNRKDFYSMSKDCDYYKVWQDREGFHLKMTHHDGSVNITMRLLTEKGLRYLDNCERQYKDPSINSLMCSPYSKSLRCIKGKEETYLF